MGLELGQDPPVIHWFEENHPGCWKEHWVWGPTDNIIGERSRPCLQTVLVRAALKEGFVPVPQAINLMKRKREKEKEEEMEHEPYRHHPSIIRHRQGPATILVQRDAAMRQHRSPYGAIAYRALIGPRAGGVPSYHGYSVDSINLCDKQSSHCEGGLVLAAYSFALISC